MNILGGLIGVIVGFLVVKYSVQITNTLGNIDWAEQHLRSGLAGTISLYRIVGIIMIILSFLFMFGGLGRLISPLGTVF